jgi:hypothetical protein
VEPLSQNQAVLDLVERQDRNLAEPLSQNQAVLDLVAPQNRNLVEPLSQNQAVPGLVAQPDQNLVEPPNPVQVGRDLVAQQNLSLVEQHNLNQGEAPDLRHLQGHLLHSQPKLVLHNLRHRSRVRHKRIRHKRIRLQQIRLKRIHLKPISLQQIHHKLQPLLRPVAEVLLGALAHLVAEVLQVALRVAEVLETKMAATVITMETRSAAQTMVEVRSMLMLRFTSAITKADVAALEARVPEVITSTTPTAVVITLVSCCLMSRLIHLVSMCLLVTSLVGSIS